MTTYPIHELFATFQGEGSAMGLPAFFVRTFGCPVKCTFCDAAGTWHPDWIPKDIARLSPGQIADAAQESGINRVVVTGGEPTIFDLRPLVDECQSRAMEAHLETSGAFEIRGDFDWIVLSPKEAKPPLPSSVGQADEFKVIVEKPGDIGHFTRMLINTGKLRLEDPRHIWLHPEWSQRGNKEVLAAIVEQVKRGKGIYRAGWQIHKLYMADAMDPRSMPLVPLGGIPERGY